MKKIILAFSAGIMIASIPTVFALTKNFPDVPPDQWYSEAVISLSEKEVVEGYNDGTFKPTENVTRAELVTMLDRLIEQERQMDESCGHLIEFEKHIWFNDLNDTFLETFHPETSPVDNLANPYGYGCLTHGFYFIFMPGENIHGCDGLYRYNLIGNEIIKIEAEDAFCPSAITHLGDNYLTFEGTYEAGDVCNKFESKYLIFDNIIETRKKDC